MQSPPDTRSDAALIVPTIKTTCPQDRRTFAIVANPLIHMALILAIVGYCYHRTLGSFFLADDIGEVSYVNAIFQGRPDLLWANFTGNYMQIPSMSVYRPWLLMSLVIDYLLWKNQAFGYYLTNILFFGGSAILIYALIRRLTAAWGQRRSATASLLSGAMFAAYPLHCESVSWVVGRVDIICCFFYLACLNMLAAYNQRRSWQLMIGAVGCFWLSILTKEMGIGLAPMAALIGLFWTSASDRPSPASRFKNALYLSWPLWICTITYFALRLAFLGTVTGGYVGGIGDSQWTSIISKWTDWDTLRRIFFPLNYSVFQDRGIYPPLVAAAYSILCAVSLLRLISRDFSWRWASFLTLWAATTVVPIYQLWGLGYNLEGSRFYFFLTVPLSILIATVGLAPRRPCSLISPPLFARLTVLHVLASVALVLTLSRITYFNNIPWVHAGKQVKAVLSDCRRLAASFEPGARLAVLGIPKDSGGAHMLLNAPTFQMLLSPLFSKHPITATFLSFDPILFGDPEKIDLARFRQTASDSNLKGVYLWDQVSRRFEKLPNNAAFDGATPAYTAYGLSADGSRFPMKGPGLRIEHAQAGDGFSLDFASDISTKDVMTFNLAIKNLRSPSVIVVGWSGDKGHGTTEPLPIALQDGEATVVVPVGRYWRWHACHTIRSVQIHLPAAERVSVENLSFAHVDELSPRLSLMGSDLLPEGIYDCPGANSRLILDATSSKAGGSGLLLEISKKDYFFENFKASDQGRAVAQALYFTANQETLPFKRHWFGKTGYYQLRAVSISPDGRPLGLYSDPITVRF